jgi:hypothetical protein
MTFPAGNEWTEAMDRLADASLACETHDGRVLAWSDKLMARETIALIAGKVDKLRFELDKVCEILDTQMPSVTQHLCFPRHVRSPIVMLVLRNVSVRLE